MPSDDFEQIVSQHYEPLYTFAFSLTRTEADACDLTQQTFYIWATKGHQLRDRSKVKSWLFTILHREFMNIRRRAVRFPHFELSDAIEDLPTISPEVVNTLDAAQVLQFLGQIQEPYRAALSLLYMEDCSYKEIADILEIPLGTVRSRISRGMAHLQRSILLGTAATSLRAMPESDTTEPHSRKMGNVPALLAYATKTETLNERKPMKLNSHIHKTAVGALCVLALSPALMFAADKTHLSRARGIIKSAGCVGGGARPQANQIEIHPRHES